MDPALVSFIEKVWNNAGIPGLIGLFIWYWVLPRLDKHLAILNASLEVQKDKAIITADKLVKIETQVGAIHEHIIAPPTRPSWMDKFPKTSSP